MKKNEINITLKLSYCIELITLLEYRVAANQYKKANHQLFGLSKASSSDNSRILFADSDVLITNSLIELDIFMVHFNNFSILMLLIAS